MLNKNLCIKKLIRSCKIIFLNSKGRFYTSYYTNIQVVENVGKKLYCLVNFQNIK